jgi:hypothetical protein
MGLFSKLFGSNPPAAAKPEAEVQPEADMIPTPQVMNAYVPVAARPTPIDVHERETVPRLDALVVGERPTVVAPQPGAPPPVPRPQPTVARAQAKQPAKERTPPAPPSVPRPTTGQANKPAVPAPANKPPVPAATRKPASAPPPLPSPPNADDLDAGFAAIERKSNRPAGPGTFEVDHTELRQLFGRMATNHMRQVRDFIIELRWGPTQTTWISVCESSVHSLRRAAEGLEFTALATKLNDLAKAMLAQDLAFATIIDGAARDRILAAHAELAEILPETFALDGDRSQREAAILHSLLSQITDVGKVTIDKLYAAGLTTLETMLLATAEDLAATTGIPQVLAARIVERFHLYRQEMASVAVDETRTYERGKIGALVIQLRKENEEFAQAAAGWTPDARQRKKDILLTRTQTMIAIDLQLARLGEIALVRELERLPFARKLTRLEEFLALAHDGRAAAAP